MILSLHIGAGFDVIQRPAEAPVDHLMVLACQISAITAQDLLFGPTLRKFPDLKVALSEGGIGWIPFYFDRIDRHFTNQEWLHGGDDFGGKMPSEVFREHILACYITDPSGPAAAGPHRHRHHRLGVRLPPHRHDVAGVAGVGVEGAAGRELHRRGDPQDHLGERLPLLRLGSLRAHAARGHDRRRAAPPGRGRRRRRHPHAPRRVEEAERGRRASASPPDRVLH